MPADGGGAVALRMRPVRLGLRRGESRVELLVLGALMVWTLAPIALMIAHALGAHERLTGADGGIASDQLQYLAWAKDAASHGLASNLFEPSRTAHVFIHPMFTLTGALHRLGVPLVAGYWLWKPIAVVVLFVGATWWSARLFPARRGARLAAIVLCLFLFNPLFLLALHAGIGSGGQQVQLIQLAGELFVAGQLWGYLPEAIAVGLMPVVVLAIDRALRGPRPGRFVALAGVAALLATWVHPWQGAVLVLMMLGLLGWGQGQRWRLFAVPIAAALLPLGYYVLLSQLDPAWRLASHNEIWPHLGAGAWAVGMAPLLIPAVIGLRKPGGDLVERAVLLWVPASLLVYLFVAFPPHALEGISLPLAILYVRGWERLRLSSLRIFAVPRLSVIVGWIVIAVVAVLGVRSWTRWMRHTVHGSNGPWYLSASDTRALDWISSRAPAGAVLASEPLADVIPSQTGRAVWVGQGYWSIDFRRRQRIIRTLFTGGFSTDAARRVVLNSTVRLVFADCVTSSDLKRALAPIVSSTHRFGCATVYVVHSAVPTSCRHTSRHLIGSSCARMCRRPLVARNV